MGIIVSDSLSPRAHVMDIVSKAHRQAALILRAFISQDVKLLLRVYVVFVRPLLEHNTVIWTSYHRLCDSASPVLTATVFVSGKGLCSTHYRIDTPQPITKTFVTSDYVGEPYSCTKLGAHKSRWASGHMGEI